MRPYNLGDWMTTLIERTDHEPRLLPYVISALTDEAELVQTEAADLMVGGAGSFTPC